MKQFGIETRPRTPIRRDQGTQPQEWLRQLELSPGTAAWEVTVALDDHAQTPSAHLHIAIEPDEWGFRFERGGELSWIRVRGAPSVYLRDDFGLLGETRTLRELPMMVRALEKRFSFEFRRSDAAVHGDLHDPAGSIGRWVSRL